MARNTSSMKRYHPQRPGDAPSTAVPGYFDPGAKYGAGARNKFLKSGIGTKLWENNPDTAYQRAVAQGGVGPGNNPFDAFVQSQYGDIDSGYQQAQMTNDNLTRRKYMSGLGVNMMGGDQARFIDYLREKFLQQSAAQRGEDQPAYGQGPGKWLAF